MNIPPKIPPIDHPSTCNRTIVSLSLHQSFILVQKQTANLPHLPQTRHNPNNWTLSLSLSLFLYPSPLLLPLQIGYNRLHPPDHPPKSIRVD